MDLPKFLDLLHSRALYLRRSDGFTDRLEGALFPSFRESMNQAFAQGITSFDADHFYSRARKENYVSCWSIGARDNMALWQLFGDLKTSVALTSTINRLVFCGVAWSRPMQLHKVRYVDHRQVRTDAMGSFSDPLKYKSDAYKFEREIRIIIPQQELGSVDNPMGIRLAVPDLNSLVRSVVVAPDADVSFFGALRDLCSRYGLTAPVRRSALSLMSV